MSLMEHYVVTANINERVSKSEGQMVDLHDTLTLVQTSAEQTKWTIKQQQTYYHWLNKQKPIQNKNKNTNKGTITSWIKFKKIKKKTPTYEIQPVE